LNSSSHGKYDWISQLASSRSPFASVQVCTAHAIFCHLYFAR